MNQSDSLDGVPAFGPLLARAYARYWLDHSTFLARHFDEIARQFDIRGATLCDVACGEGTFAVAMAKKGWYVFGVDASQAMTDLAQAKVREHHVAGTFLRQDMRTFTLPEPADLVTCWYNSLNYLLTQEDLARTFGAMARALVPGGWLLFDVYTLYGLETEWADRPWIAVDVDDCFVVSRTRYDPQTHRAEVTFTGFLREGSHGEVPHYVRFEERHEHRGYPWTTLKRFLGEAGFEVRGQFTMPGFGTPDKWTKRVYGAARKR